jgi:hypothetical protein
MGVVERMTGLTRRQIRYYESAGLLEPYRTGGGHRLYSDRDVRTLIRIKALLQSGFHTMRAVSRALRADVDMAVGGSGRGRIPGGGGGGAPRAKDSTDSASYFRRHQVLPLWQRSEDRSPLPGSSLSQQLLRRK